VHHHELHSELGFLATRAGFMRNTYRYFFTIFLKLWKIRVRGVCESSLLLHTTLLKKQNHWLRHKAKKTKLHCNYFLVFS